MNFIDLFNFSQYFNREGDGSKAKVGHVNAVIEELTTLQDTVANIETTVNNLPTGETVLTTTVTIDETQIATLGSSPVTLLPSLDSLMSLNTFYNIHEVQVFSFGCDFASFGNDDHLIIKYGDTFTQINGGIIKNGLDQYTIAKNIFLGYEDTAGTTILYKARFGQNFTSVPAVILDTNSQTSPYSPDPGLGIGTLKVILKYTIEQLPTLI